MNNTNDGYIKYSNYSEFLIIVTVIFAPLIIAFYAFNGYQWDFSVPIRYDNYDTVWQLLLTKGLLDNGWILNNFYLGAPHFAEGYINAAAQTSSLHSILMKLIGVFVNDSVRVQNYYYFFNFSLISLTSYISCRLLGVSKLFSVPIGIIFSLSLYRLNFVLYAYLANYFMVPLIIVVIIWCARGDFINKEINGYREIICSLKKSKKFLFSLLIILLTALSDGYYNFFAILLIGFSSLLVFFYKPAYRMSNVLIPVSFSIIMIMVSLLMMKPLADYKKNNHDVFFPGGKPEIAFITNAFESEVYSGSLKTLLIPNLDHPIKKISEYANKMRDSGIESRKHGYGVTGQLGILVSICFLILISVFLNPRWILENKFVSQDFDNANIKSGITIYFLAVFSAFIFLCLTFGGLGSLIALIFPSIRAYQRYSVFLIYIVLIAVGIYLTYSISDVAKKKCSTFLFVFLISGLTIFDQIPKNWSVSMEAPHVKRFLAERDFIQTIEKDLRLNGMVYQYPYAEFLSLSPYYGYGSTGQSRSYLHSKTIHWSTGASKNSKVDLWHKELAKMTFEDLLEKLAIYNFKGILIDLTVIKNSEYQSLINAAKLIGASSFLDNKIAEMSYFKLPDYGFYITMDKDFNLPVKITINKSVFLNLTKIPSFINSDLLIEILSKNNNNKEILEFYFKDYTDLFIYKEYLDEKIEFNDKINISELLGDVYCNKKQINVSSNTISRVNIKIKNNSIYPWQFQSGSYPITIGYHIRDRYGAITKSGGIPIKKPRLLKTGASADVVLFIDDLKITKLDEKISFELVQEGNMWFGANSVNNICTMQFIQ